MKKIKRFAAALGSAALLCTFGASSVWAAVDLNAVYGISSNEIPGWPKGPEVSADTAVLMDADSGIVLYDKGADELRYPASITKLMTLLVAVEHADLTDTVTFTETGVRDVTPDSSNIGMQLGETLTMEDCLYAVNIASANEVAAQVAEYVGGTEQDFINMMNEKAAELGCANTHFVNASGLPDPNQYTTARDMALIFQAGLQNETFRKIMGTVSYVIEPTNMNSQSRKLHTHHPMMAKETDLYYEGCLGGKTGHTNDAGSTLVTGAERNGVTYIAVVMRTADLGPSCVDTTALFDYGFQNFQKTEVPGGYVLLPATTSLEGLARETKDGNGTEQDFYYYGEYLVGTGSGAEEAQTAQPTEAVEAQTAQPAEAEEEKESTPEVSKEQQEEPEQGLSATAKALLAVMAVMGVVLLVLIAALLVKVHKR